jgi:hypothetical protein
MNTGIISTAQLVRKATFTADQELGSAERVLSFAKLLFGVTPIELRAVLCIISQTNVTSLNQAFAVWMTRVFLFQKDRQVGATVSGEVDRPVLPCVQLVKGKGKVVPVL